MIYACSRCFRVHNEKSLAKDSEGKYYCSQPGCEEELIQIDEMILETILLLWRKGYDTSACCSGHCQGNAYNVPYIIFSDKQDKDLFPLPKGFVMKGLREGTILEPKKKMRAPDMHTIFRRNDRLLTWAEKIPKIF